LFSDALLVLWLQLDKRRIVLARTHKRSPGAAIERIRRQ
jgi:hypothetical protein